MNLLELLNSLVPLVQLLLVLGFHILLFFIACHKSAGENLLTFFREFYKFFQEVKYNKLEKVLQKTIRVEVDRILAEKHKET
jgi:hypothetical protein